MADNTERGRILSDDEQTLQRLGYAQELARRMSGFSNYAISLSIICILAGGVTSFQVGFGSVGGAAIGIGWPVSCLFSLVVAATMAQVASAFPTAGGLYHWASILGGRGWGWVTAWFNLAGLVTVVAAVNAGAWDFIVGALQLQLGANAGVIKALGVTAITFSHALFNDKGIRLTTRLTDFSGWWILLVSIALMAALLAGARALDFGRLWSFTNFSGVPADAPVFPKLDSLAWLFALGILLPAYTITGFDASAHTSEETIGAAVNVPRGIVRSVLVSGVFGWAMLCAVVLAMPDLRTAAEQGANVFYWTVNAVVGGGSAKALYLAIGLAQYFCGLAALTSASRMAYAFARDGGLPAVLRQVSPASRTPSAAIWAMAIVAVAFMVFVPYTTIAAVCVIFLYISYVLPTVAGFFAHGRTWTAMGPWHLGGWYKPMAVVSVLFCVFLIVIGMQPPNQQAVWLVGGAVGLLAAAWFGFERKRFSGPPQIKPLP
jgi:amino acid transporter